MKKFPCKECLIKKVCDKPCSRVKLSSDAYAIHMIGVAHSSEKCISCGEKVKRKTRCSSCNNHLYKMASCISLLTHAERS